MLGLARVFLVLLGFDWFCLMLIGFAWFQLILLGFDLEAGPGKMMGLSSYGKPTFFDERFVGNTEDIEFSASDTTETTLEYCVFYE